MKRVPFRTCLLTLAVIVAVSALTGCPQSRKTGDLVGWVKDTDGDMLPLVKVSLDNGEETYTDGHGLFTFEGVSAGKSQVLAFSLEGYASSSRPVDIEAGGTSSVDATLKRLDDGEVIQNAQTGGEAADSAGNSVTVPGDALEGGQSKALTGQVTVHVTAIDTTDPDDLEGFPGTFETTQNGETVLLNAYALANFCAWANGESIQVRAGAQVTIYLRLPSVTDLEAGDEVALWYFDATVGLWVSAGTGTVESQGGHLVFVAHVSAFGWWCCAVTCPSPHTIAGHAYDQDSLPVEGALIRAVDLDYHIRTFARTDETGAYSVPVKPDAQVRLDLILPGAYYIADSLQVASGAAGETTTDQDLYATFDSCISGYVTEEDKVTPIEGETVYSSTGGTATTDADGYFCIPAPAGTKVAVYVIGRPPKVVTTPASASCATGGCAEVLLSVDYPEDGDLVGFILSTLATHNTLFSGEVKDLASLAMFYSGLDGDQMDLLNVDTIEDSCDVYTTSVDPAFSLAIYLSLALGQDQLAFDLVFSLGFTRNELFSLEAGDVPKCDKIGALDPGSPGALTDGVTAIDMICPLDWLVGFRGDGSPADLGYAFLEPWMGGFFYQDGLFARNLFDSGDTLTYSWPGGIDLGPFDVDGVIPGRLDFTLTTGLGDLFDGDTLANGFPLTWDTTAPGDFLVVMLETVLIDNAKGRCELGAVVCTLEDDGSYTIPGDVIAQLPQAQGDIALQVNYLFAKRYAIATEDVPLRRGNGDGYVALLTSTEPARAWSLDAQFQVGKDGQE